MIVRVIFFLSGACIGWCIVRVVSWFVYGVLIQRLAKRHNIQVCDVIRLVDDLYANDFVSIERRAQ